MSETLKNIEYIELFDSMPHRIEEIPDADLRKIPFDERVSIGLLKFADAQPGLNCKKSAVKSYTEAISLRATEQIEALPRKPEADYDLKPTSKRLLDFSSLEFVASTTIKLHERSSNHPAHPTLSPSGACESWDCLAKSLTGTIEHIPKTQIEVLYGARSLYGPVREFYRDFLPANITYIAFAKTVYGEDPGQWPEFIKTEIDLLQGNDLFRTATRRVFEE